MDHLLVHYTFGVIGNKNSRPMRSHKFSQGQMQLWATLREGFVESKSNFIVELLTMTGKNEKAGKRFKFYIRRFIHMMSALI